MPRRQECHFFQLVKTKRNYVPRFADTMNNLRVILQLCIQNAKIQYEGEFAGGGVTQANYSAR